MLEFSCAGVRVRVSMLFPAMTIVLLTFEESAFVLSCLLASLLHEAGHALAMLTVRDRPSRVTVGIFGVRIERSSERLLPYRAACLVSLGGPLMNAVCATVLYLLGLPIGATVHAVLALFNLLPITSLDGGEALYALLCTHLPEERAERILRRLSVATVFPLAVIGFCTLFASGYNVTLLVLCGYLIILLLLKEKH